MHRWHRKTRSRATPAAVVTLLLACFFCVGARAQSADDLLDQSYHAMYNLQFDEALKKAGDAQALVPDDPLPWMAEASAVLFREFDRLHILTSEMFTSDDKFAARSAHAWDPQLRKQFDDALANAEKVAQQRLGRDK